MGSERSGWPTLQISINSFSKCWRGYIHTHTHLPLPSSHPVTYLLALRATSSSTPAMQSLGSPERRLVDLRPWLASTRKKSLGNGEGGKQRLLSLVMGFSGSGRRSTAQVGWGWGSQGLLTQSYSTLKKIHSHGIF